MFFHLPPPLRGRPGLKLEGEYITATLRCILQLIFLGMILGPVIAANEPIWVVVVCFCMLLIAASEAPPRVVEEA
eukprot:gene8558-4141_t